MNYSQITVFNFRVSYYVMRIFGLYWLTTQFLKFEDLKSRPIELNEPVFRLQKIIFHEYPETLLYASTVILCGILFIWTFFKQSYLANLTIFILTIFISLPISANYGVHHDNHLVILGFFLSIFLIPEKLNSKDYKLVQYFYLGLLMTYTMAGFWKFLGTLKNIIKQTDKVIWIDKNAAKLNTFDNYYRADQAIPVWMINIYSYENLWVMLTFLGISFQFLCFLGAFNRKLLTFFMVFIFLFHLYTMKFVLADFQNASYFSIAVFFPYHIFEPFLKSKFFTKYVTS